MPELDAMNPEMEPQQGQQVIGLHGEDDREGAMAKADLYKLANYSFKLFKKIQDEDQLEAWVQAKITKAADYIASVYHYLEYEMEFSEYGHQLDNSDVMSESQKAVLKNKLMEAKEKIKALKVKQAEKIKPKDKKVEEGILSGGDRPCTECGGTGMVYEEPKAIPDHVKSKVEKYNRQATAFHAASKRIDANKNGIPDQDEMEEGFDEKSKVGDTKKTRTGELTKTSTGVVHKNTSYADDGEAEEKSGKGIKSHAKSQSAAEKKEKAPAQKMSPKSAKTWGMKDNEKFDNRDKVDEAKKKGDGNLANNAKPYDKVTRGDVIAGRLGKDEKGGKDKKVKEELKGDQAKLDVDGDKKIEKSDLAALRAGKKEKKVDEASKPSAGLTKGEKSAVVKKAKAGGDIGKPGKSFDKVAKAAGGGKKGEKIAAAAMWKNIKESVKAKQEEESIEEVQSVMPSRNEPANAAPATDASANYSQEKKDAIAKAKRQGAIMPSRGKEMMDKAMAMPESINESAEVDRIRSLMTRLNG